MSEIAKALANAAKITESRRLEQVRQQTAAAVRKNQARMFVWGGLLASVCLVAFGVLWTRSGSTASLPPVVPLSQPLEEVTPRPDANAAPQPDPELEADLRKLVIKGLIKSSDPRVLIGNRVFKVGDELSPGLVLSGLDEEDLIATDAEGATYRKNYSFPVAASEPPSQAASSSQKNLTVERK